MQEGIGRGGYRVLTLVFFMLGALGLASSLYAFNLAKADGATAAPGLYDWLGFALTAIALVSLGILALIVLGKGAPTASKVRTLQPVPDDWESAPAPGLRTTTNGKRSPVGVDPSRPLVQGLPPAAPDNDPGLEFDDVAPALATGPGTIVSSSGARIARTPAAPTPPPAPRTPPVARVPLPDVPRQAPVLPPNRNIGLDTKGWPARHGPSGITRREMIEGRRANGSALLMTSDGEAVDVQEPTPAPTPPTAGRRTPSFKPVPTIVAKTAPATDDADWQKPGTSRGKCGGCGTILLAPQQRPVNIRCPRCDKVTLVK